MLMYSEGAMFKPHTESVSLHLGFSFRLIFRSTEKIPNMFGTLVISLPSAHTGGEVVVRHCGKKATYKTSEAYHSIIAWYSDVTHEVLPVISGYRWVLTYNLALDGSAGLSRPSASLAPSEEVARIHETLREWTPSSNIYGDGNFMYHVLDYDYTEAQCSLRSLKAEDLARVTALKEACKDLPVDIFFALLEKEESGTCEENDSDNGYYDPYDHYGGRRGQNWRHPDSDVDSGEDEDEDDGDSEEAHMLDDVTDTQYRVKTLVDLNGNTVAEGLSFDTDECTCDDPFDGVEIDHEDYEGYMGSWGPQATHWYRITVSGTASVDLTILRRTRL